MNAKSKSGMRDGTKKGARQAPLSKPSPSTTKKVGVTGPMGKSAPSSLKKIGITPPKAGKK